MKPVVPGASPLRSSFFLALILVFSSSFADGPVGLSSLPGGGDLSDSDNGTGETWGRTNGRDWSYNNFDLLLFNDLTWGTVDAGSVGIAFDGTINSGTQEVLSLSSINGNQAIWEGGTQVELFLSGGGTTIQPVDTRFVLTISSGGGPFNLFENTVNNLPYVDVIAANGEFVANLKMEARLPGSIIWEGALDLFDRLSTTGEGIAMTSFNSGFFFTLTGGGSGGMSIEEHDSNMINQTGGLAGDLEFLTIESVNRLTDLGEKTNTIENLIRNLSGNELRELLERAGSLDQLIRELHSGGGGDDGAGLDEIRQIVSDSREELTQIIIFLWGLSPGGEGFPDPADVPQITDLSTQESVDALALLLSNLFADQNGDISALNAKIDQLQQQLATLQALPVLKLEVIGSNRSSGKNRRLLVLSQDNGVPVTASRFAVSAVIENKKTGFSLVSIESTSRDVGAGLVELNLRLPKALRSAKIFQISAEHDHDAGSSHQASTIFGGSQSVGE